jgi:hypothetical protein
MALALAEVVIDATLGERAGQLAIIQGCGD